METHFFRYQILRYIADLRRMEPENIGIVIQNSEKASCRFHTRLGNRAGFDYDNYRRWREFFEAEINGDAVPIFQPDRASAEFLLYLQERCSGNYSLTRPLELVLDTDNLEKAETHLFQTLVLKPDDKASNSKQPVKRLRSELKQRHILNNPAFHTKQLFKTNGLTELVEYFYVRNHGADLPVIIQPVQISSDISRTINGLERAESLVSNLREAKVRTEITVVVDEIPAETNQVTDKEKWAYDRIIKSKRHLEQQEVNVVDSTLGTVRLVNNVAQDLDGIAPPQTALAFA